jgi:hypothetical protein
LKETIKEKWLTQMELRSATFFHYVPSQRHKSQKKKNLAYYTNLINVNKRR